MLEGDPGHRGIAMSKVQFKSFWLSATSEWEGLWDKGVFKKWKRSDLLKNDPVFFYSSHTCQVPDYQSIIHKPTPSSVNF